MAVIYTQSDLAKLTSLSRQAVAKAFGNDPLSRAKVGQRIDIAHPLAREWLLSRGIDPATICPATKRPNLSTLSTGVPEVSTAQAVPDSSAVNEPRPSIDPRLQAPSDIMSMTLMEITERHGTSPEFIDWLKARKELAMVQMREAQHDELQGRLIERDFVEQFVFGYLDELNKRLLTDTAKTLSRKAYHDGAAKVPIAETEAAAVKMISDQLKATKARITRELTKKAKPNAEPTV